MLRLLAVGLEEHGRKSATTLSSSACRVAELGICLIHGRMLLLEGRLFLAETWVIDSGKLSSSLTLGSVVHQSFDCLFALKTSRLHLVEWGVHDLLVHGLEFSKVGEIDLDVGLLVHELANNSEDVVKWDLKSLLLEVDVLSHSWISGLDSRPKHHRGLAFELSHRGAVFEAVGL